MTAQGHLLFSVTCTLLAHKLQLTPALSDASLWQTIPAALASALLPDLDHPKSVLGQRLPWISKPLSRLFGHRGFTHSLLAVTAAVWGLAHAGGYSAVLAHQASLPAARLAPQEWWRHRNRLLHSHPAGGRLVVRLATDGMNSVKPAFKNPPHPVPHSGTMRALSAVRTPYSPK